MGDDFTYRDASFNFNEMDLLIKHFNEKYQDIQLIYSTAT